MVDNGGGGVIVNVGDIAAGDMGPKSQLLV